MDQDEVDKILKKISNETYEQILKSFKIEASEKKSENITAFQDFAYENGAKQLALQLKLEVIKELATDIKLQDDDEEKVTNTKNSISKRLGEKVRDSGLEETLKGAKKENLEDILDLIGVEKKADSVKGLITQLADQIRIIGIALAFSKLTVALLREVCDELKIDSSSGSNSQLVSLIIGEPVVKREKPAPAKITKNKPELVKGAAVDNIAWHYSKTELEEFCNTNKISEKGKKRELAKRIVGYLNGDEPEEPKAKRAKKEKKEKTEKKKDTKTKKTTSTKEKPKEKATTKEPKTKGPKETTTTSEQTTEDDKKTPTPKSPKAKRKAEDDEETTTKSPKKSKTENGDKYLSDFVFAIAGKFEGGETHANLEREIKKLGGKISDGIVDETTHLLVPDIAATNSKIQKAKENNVKVVALDFIRKSK